MLVGLGEGTGVVVGIGSGPCAMVRVSGAILLA